MRQNRSKRILVRAAVVVLLFAVAGLSVVARQGKYLPKSDPLHLIARAAKMQLLHQPLSVVPPATCVASRTAPPQPEFFSTLLILHESLILRQIGLEISFLRRAPPCSLA
jgi:hypothetical protein